MKKNMLFYICVIAAAFIGFIIMPIANQHTRTTVTVVRIVGDQPIPIGTQLRETDLTTVEIGAFGLGDNVARKIEDVKDMYTLTELFPGDNITTDKVSHTLPLDDNLYSIERGTCAMSVTIDTLAAGFSAKLQQGDVVSVYSVVENDTSASGVDIALDPLLQYMEIMAVTNAKASNADASKAATQEEAIVSTVVFRCQPNQAAKLLEIESTGTVHLAFVGRTEEAKAQLKAFNEYISEQKAA